MLCVLISEFCRFFMILFSTFTLQVACCFISKIVRVWISPFSYRLIKRYSVNEVICMADRPYGSHNGRYHTPTNERRRYITTRLWAIMSAMAITQAWHQRWRHPFDPVIRPGENRWTYARELRQTKRQSELRWLISWLFMLLLRGFIRAFMAVQVLHQKSLE